MYVLNYRSKARTLVINMINIANAEKTQEIRIIKLKQRLMKENERGSSQLAVTAANHSLIVSADPSGPRSNHRAPSCSDLITFYLLPNHIVEQRIFYVTYSWANSYHM